MNGLFDAIIEDDVRAVKKLLREDAGCAIRLVRTPKLCESGIFHWIYAGDTALHLAAAGYRVKIVQLLLNSDADPNAARSRRKSSPLHYAADGFITGPAWNAEQQAATIRCLIERGGDIHLQDANGATPLHRAVRTRCAAAVKTLLKAGADPSMKNKSGSTPFHLAVQNTGRGGTGAQVAIDAQREIIQQFLSSGASVNLRDGRGRSVGESARSSWIQDLLDSHAK
jgi:ankyrin repeat protein